MAKQTKMTKTEIIDKIIKTIEVAIAPAVVTAGTIWGFDIGIYVAAFTSAIIAILTCVKLFVK